MSTTAVPPHLSSDEQHALEQYDCGPLAPVRRLGGGMFAAPLLIDSPGGRLVLKTHQFRPTETAFRFQAETMHWVHHQSGLCPTVLPTAAGAWCVTRRDGAGVISLCPYAEGRTLDWHDWHRKKEADSQFLRSLGSAVARLHNVLRTAAPGGDATLSTSLPPIQFSHLASVRERWLETFDAVLTSTNPTRSARQFAASKPAIAAAWQHLVAFVEWHGLDGVHQQIVHGDVSPVNMVWAGVSGSEPCVTFIDWDTVHVGHRMYDALGDVLNRVPADRPDWNQFRHDHVQDYLAGYSETIDEPVTEAEHGMVPAFALARQLEDLRQRLAVLPALPAARDQEYSQLIAMRVEMINQIRRCLSS